jgi:isoleucyl-tRNA synthetase
LIHFHHHNEHSESTIDMSDTEKNTNADLYKETVFLPNTDFPMRGNLPEKEPDMIARWQELDLYKRLREESKGREKFILHDGPPYANGHLHMGHALNKVLKDVINSYWQMAGYDAPYVPGWDCHGLPIEWKIEEKYRDAGQDKDNIDILTFRKECREFAKNWVGIQAEEFQRLGVTGDWKDPYLTMTHKAEGKIAREIHEFAKNGGLYKGVKPVLWSTVEKTALAEAEVEYKEHKSITIWIKFPIVKAPAKPELEGASIVIWTTTPWTMPSNRAVAYGENIEYALYEVQEIAEGSKAVIGDKILLSTTLADDVKEKAKITELTKLSTYKGSDFEGLICHHPLRDSGYDFDVPALCGDFVTNEAGTGFVHIAPSHGADDYMLYMSHFGAGDIPDNVADDGKFHDHVPLFAGLEVYTDKGELGGGNFAVLKAMDEAKALLAKGSMRHEYPHSWRSKAPLIFRTTPQWFISMETNDLRKTALNAISDTKWVPEKGEARIRAMIENRPDWCISRQRAWGVPIALFVSKETGEPLTDESVLNRIGSIFEDEGSDAWWARPAQDFLGNDYNAEDYDQVFDIVDVWFESGCTHAFVVGEREELQKPNLPKGTPSCDLYLEGSDQHRGWFHSSLLESCGTRGHAPYETVLTHGFVLDEKGYKMSKSMGNVVDPKDICNEFGADILRLWTMMSDYSEDLRIGKDSIKSAADIYRRIRNTFRFLLGAIDGITPAELVDLSDTDSLPELEQYMLHRIHQVNGQMREYCGKYEFLRAVKLLHDFCNEDLSAFYFDIRKDCLYCDREDSIKRRATRTLMAKLFECLTSWFAPILCFTAEEAWSHRPEGIYSHSDSIHLRTFPEIPESWENERTASYWEDVIETRNLVLRAIEPLRADKTLRSSLEAKPIITTSSKNILFYADDMADICITSQADVLEGENEVIIEKSDGEKCQRCWKILPEVGENSDYPEICNRCADAVEHHNKIKKAA